MKKGVPGVCMVLWCYGAAPLAAQAPTVRATRLSQGLEMDGRLDEEAYRTVPPVSGFTQEDPIPGAPATQKTEVWVFFDDDNVYVSARCWTDHPERIVANEMRRDNPTIFQANDTFAFMFDTFHDRRNSVLFHASPLSARTDTEITDEGQAFSQNWNPVWILKAGRFEGGWTVEAAVPFASLRYRPGKEQVWGFNARRISQWNRELSHLAPMPVGRGVNAINLVSRAGTLVGLEAPARMRRIELKPFATSAVTTDRLASPTIENAGDADAGLDVKYAITRNLTADFTLNTDFAQVEADEQQVNLTRFSLFFPEKREFFLENSGAFTFGGAYVPGQSANDVPSLFYSRRIGLQAGRAVPIVAGGRMTGRVGRTSVGVLNIQADDEPLSQSPATNFSVVRLKQDILRRSSVGLMYTGRSVAESRIGRNDAYGVDASFGFFDSLAMSGYWAKTRTDGLAGDDQSHRLLLDYTADRYGLKLERLAIGDHFNPEVGFLRRDDIRKHVAVARFSPRPRNSRRVRKYTYTASMERSTDGRGRLDLREHQAEFSVDYLSGDRLFLSYSDFYEFLAAPFRIGPGAPVPAGGYDYATVSGTFTFSARRPLAGSVNVGTGSFYNGTKTQVGVSGGRVELTARFSLQPSASINWIDLKQGAFRTTLIGSRVTFTMTPLMFASALIQYNSANRTAATNVRFRWEYQSGSELFVVFNEQRDTFAGWSDLANRAFIVKINKLLRF